MAEKSGPPQSERAWALQYNGYERLASTPNDLYTHVLRPAREEFERSLAVPTWCGVDFLRGWLFLQQREDYHEGGWPPSLGIEWVSVLYAVFDHPTSKAQDRPSTIFGRTPRKLGPDRPAYSAVVEGEEVTLTEIWRGPQLVGWLASGAQSVSYGGVTAPGLTRLVTDQLSELAEEGRPAARATEKVLSLLASIPSIEPGERSPWFRWGHSDRLGFDAVDPELGPGADFALATDEVDDEIVHGLLSVDAHDIVRVREYGRWVTPSSDEWVERLNGFAVHPVRPQALAVVESWAQPSLDLLGPYLIGARSRL